MKDNNNNNKDKENQFIFNDSIKINENKRSKINNIDNYPLIPKSEVNKNISTNKLETIHCEQNKDEIRHSPVFEILGIKSRDKKNYDKISSDFKKYEKKFNINISYSNKKELKFETPLETSKIINILSLPTEKRTFDDVIFLKKYFLTTKIENLFKDEFNNKEESIDKLLTFFALEMKYRLFQKDDILFRIGDLSVYLFLIIQGKVEILKPIAEIKPMTGYEYFSYILDLRNNSEEYLLNLSIDDNFKEYDIDKNDIDQFPSIYVLNLLEKYKIYQNINLKEELEFLNIEPEDLELDSEKIDSNEYVLLKLRHIKEKFSNIPQDKVIKYKFFVDHIERKQVKIYKYISFMKLEKDAYFGESAMGENEKRNATVKILEDSSLGYISASLYKTNFFEEKKSVLENKINFLHSKFFFHQISLKRFAKKYFNLFILDSYINGNIIYNESDPINFVYFIEEGIIELSSSKTIIEIEIFLQGLENRTSSNIETNQLIYKNIASNPEDLKSYLNKTQKNRLLIFGKYEILGLESFYYNIPYFTTARVISTRAKIFKIDQKQLRQILKIEVDCMPHLKNLVLSKTNILKKRYFGINNTKLTLIDEKINSDFEIEYYKNVESKKRKLENEKIKSQRNNVLYNEIKIKTVFKSRNKRNNPYSILYSNEERKLRKKNNQEKNEKKEKKLNYWSLFENSDINNTIKLNNSFDRGKGPHTIQNDIYNNIKKNTYLEDKFLDKVKSQIRLLNNNKYFFSQIKLPLEKNKSIETIEESNIKKSSDLDISNSKDENNIDNISVKKPFKSNLFDTQIKFKKNNYSIMNDNNSTSSILPSIYSSRSKNKKNLHRSLSFINNERNNYSSSLYINNDKSIYKNSVSPNYQSSKFFALLSEKNNKNLCNKNFIGLNITKFANAYEIKNNYQKEKFRFFNDSEFFVYKKKDKSKTFEIKHLNQVNNGLNPIKFFNPKLQILNKELISKMKNNKGYIL